MKRPRRPTFLAVFVVLSGCASIVGVPDLRYSAGADGATDGGDEAQSSDAPSTPSDGSITDAGCDALLESDPKHCGACGHDCVGGDCVGGVCQPVMLLALPAHPLNYIVDHGSDLLVSTNGGPADDSLGGIWRLSKDIGPDGGTKSVTLWEDMPRAADLAVVDDTLFFLVDDNASKGGGIYSSDLTQGPLARALIAPAETPSQLVRDDKTLYFDDETKGDVMWLRPGKPVDVFRAGWSNYGMWVKGDTLYLTSLHNTGRPNASVQLEMLLPDASDSTPIDDGVALPNVIAGRLTGDTNAVYYTTWVTSGPPAGRVRRVPIEGSSISTCDFGEDANKGPYGVYVDGANVYWTNQGDFTSGNGGSVAWCPLEKSCCKATEIRTLWAGGGEPAAIMGDKDAIYWVTYRTGEVWKVAKPLAKP